MHFIKKLNNIKKFIKRFFEPAFLNKKEALKSFVEPGYSSFWFQTFPLLIFPLLITAINSGDKNQIYKLTVIVLIAYLFFWSMQYLLRHFFWSARYTFEASLEEKYRKAFLSKDTLALESYGTGKLQSIVNSGISAWADLSNQTIWFFTRFIINFIFGFYFSYKLGINFALGYFTVVIFITILLKQKMKFDEQTENIENEKNSHAVRIIMSINEILYSDKIEDEANLLRDYSLKKVITELRSADIYFWAEKVALSIGMFMPYIGASLYILNNDLTSMNIALLISFVFFAIRLSDVVWET